MFYKKKLVGTDSLGNIYYQLGCSRFVKYRTGCGPTNIEPIWYLWLHYVIDNMEEHIIQSKTLVRPLNPAGVKGGYKPEIKQNLHYSPWVPK